ncbi:MAG: type II toxin-antitoxin system prevent-host-death family antitoxin [Nitrospirales bacterium]|nr:type II toxin-antitoxin system prevent-host-death family antitoxin [Nitrospira sp.]MDR4502016.1 type II toxin-antitoxin system prevent-host-death family antitoxin [Nitrospirales bacterium]
MQMGLREANQNFSKAIKAVKSGQEVVLTERGKPIATIKPLNAHQQRDSVMRRLEEAGLLISAPKTSPLPAWTPRPINGMSMSKTLREERDQDD